MKRIKAKAGKLILQFDDKKEQWIMSGGQFGNHAICAPNCYNDRVNAHWTGYCLNNGIKINVDNMPTLTERIRS